MGLFDFRDKWESGVGQTESNENQFGGQPIDESKNNPLLQELNAFQSADSSQSVPEGWQGPTGMGDSSLDQNSPSGTIRGACLSSTTCPSGWSCVDGFCQKTNISTDTGSSSTSAGDCDIQDDDGNDVEPPFQCGSGGQTSCSNGGTCGEGAEIVQQHWYNSGWVTISSIYGGGCCNNPSLGIYIAIDEQGRRRRVKYCGPQEGGDGCTLFCNSIGAYAPELSEMFDCADKMCDPFCEDCSLGRCGPAFGTVPCFCSKAPCPDCYLCGEDGSCSVGDGTQDRCLKKAKYSCSCDCSDNVFETEGTGVFQSEADDNAREACAAKCGGEIPNCAQYCRVQCNCHADCPSGTCGEDLRCTEGAGPGDTSYIYSG